MIHWYIFVWISYQWNIHCWKLSSIKFFMDIFNCNCILAQCSFCFFFRNSYCGVRYFFFGSNTGAYCCFKIEFLFWIWWIKRAWCYNFFIFICFTFTALVLYPLSNSSTFRSSRQEVLDGCFFTFKLLVLTVLSIKYICLPFLR